MTLHTALRLRTALGNHAYVAPLKDGRVKSALIELDIVEMTPLPSAFRRMLREGDLDLCEMAMASHVLGVDAGRPITALPIPLWGRLPQCNLLCPAASSIRGPKDLEGQRVGVRAYAQTSGVWVRGILASAYGVDTESITWVTQEDAHVAEFIDPPNVERAAAGPTLRELMNAGELQAIMGEREIDPAGVRTVIPDADAAGQAWAAQVDVEPVHHILTLRRDLMIARPWLASELLRMFEEAVLVAQGAGPRPVPAYGLQANRRSFDMILGFCHDQKISRRRYTAGEIFVAV
jgi:4,5-dihydroxyphthalate decarboxylase